MSGQEESEVIELLREQNALLSRQLGQTQSTNHLLAMLIDVFSEDDEFAEEAEPRTYMDGTPV